jgi:bacillopeptidase F
MKHILVLFLSLFLVSNFSYSQNILTPALQHEMDARSNQSLDVIVYLQDEFNLMAFHQEMKIQKAGKNQRVKTIQSELKSVAEMAQTAFKSELLALSQRGYSNISFEESFWIVNAVRLQVPVDYLEAIAAIPSVKRIDINSPRYTFEEPVNEEPSQAKVVGGIEPGLAAINAPAMWEMGYTGKNLLFLSMDTGVFPNHPAISNRFLGNHRPLSQVWYGLRSPVPTDHASSSHGTHTTGTVLGLVEETNDTIGVAYNAYWIASDPVASSESDLLDPADFMNVFQWVLNPDGNEETTDDVPDVINNSWGYSYDLALAFDACNMEEAQILEVIEAAGILSPFSAGNDGPAAQTTGFPAMMAYSELNVMSVGAVNGNTDAFPIANFSSRGPTPCVETGGSLQIKPEVSAPGVSVRSCSGQDEFSLLSGTSMACPHVSGALLLLKEAYPYLDAVSLKEALYVTAHDLGEAGEDNVYGNGMIDVLAAFDYLALTYDPVPPVTDSFDLKLEIREFAGNFVCPGNENVNPKIALINRGTETLNEVHYYWRLNNGDTLTQVWNGTLTANQEVILDLPEMSLSLGHNELWVWADPIIPTREFDIYNNAETNIGYMIEPAEYPFLDDFESYENAFIDSGWFVSNPDGSVGWMLGDAPSSNPTNKALTFGFFDYFPRNAQEDALISSLIPLPDTEDQLNLSFDIAYKNRLEDFFNDSLFVLISTDCGQSFPVALYANGGGTMATVEGNTFSTLWKPESVADWDTVNLNLNDFAGEDVVIQFLTKNDEGNNLYLDNIRIYSGNADATSSQFGSSFNLFPNPARSTVLIDHDLKGEVEYSIFSVDGKCHQKGILKTDNQINLTELSHGTYVVKIQNSKHIQVSGLVIL